MNSKKLIGLISLVILFSTCKNEIKPEPISKTTLVQTELGQHVDSVLTPYVNQLRELTDNTAGLAIGITKGKEIIYAKTFGYANIETQEKADFNTVFHIASVSKPFTAIAIVKLIEQGKVNLNDKLITHIPEFKMKDEDYKDITIQHVLTHTSGIPRHVSSGDWENPTFGPLALEKNLDYVKDFELDFKPGTEYSYSNSAFDILGLVVSRVSQMPFDEYVTQHVLIPSGMTNTYYKKPKDSLPKHWAKPYSYGIETSEWSPYPYTENYFPSSGVQSTLLDMCQWGMIHLGKGKHKTYQLFEEDFFNTLVKPYYDTPWGDKIALSWYLQSYLDHPNIMHIGNDTGFEAFMTIFPEDDVSIVVMANRDFSRTGRIMNAASEAIFYEELKPYDISARYKFAEAYKTFGIDKAIQIWNTMKTDTTDIYYVNDNNILTMGAVLEASGNWEDVKSILKYYNTIDENSTYSWRLLGNAYLNLKDTLQAKACYEKTLKIDPNYEKGKIALESLTKN